MKNLEKYIWCNKKPDSGAVRGNGRQYTQEFPGFHAEKVDYQVDLP